MGTIFRMPGWFEFFEGSDRSGRHTTMLGMARHLVVNLFAKGLWQAMLNWQERNESLAALRAIDTQTMKDVGLTRELIVDRYGPNFLPANRFMKQFWLGW